MLQGCGASSLKRPTRHARVLRLFVGSIRRPHDNMSFMVQSYSDGWPRRDVSGIVRKQTQGWRHVLVISGYLPGCMRVGLEAGTLQHARASLQKVHSGLGSHKPVRNMQANAVVAHARVGGRTKRFSQTQVAQEAPVCWFLVHRSTTKLARPSAQDGHTAAVLDVLDESCAHRSRVPSS